MSYDCRFGVTTIRHGRRDNLSISFDDLGDGVIPALRYIPDTEDREHSHIRLDRKQAEKLRDWLNNYLTDEDLSGRFEKDLNKGKE